MQKERSGQHGGGILPKRKASLCKTQKRSSGEDEKEPGRKVSGSTE